MAIHAFDMVRFLLGKEPFELFAWRSYPAISEVGDIDAVRFLLRTASVKLAVITNSRRSWQRDRVNNPDLAAFLRHSYAASNSVRQFS